MRAVRFAEGVPERPRTAPKRHRAAPTLFFPCTPEVPLCLGIVFPLGQRKCGYGGVFSSEGVSSCWHYLTISLRLSYACSLPCTQKFHVDLFPL